MVEDPVMSEGDNILARIREALAVAAPVPGQIAKYMPPLGTGNGPGWLPDT